MTLNLAGGRRGLSELPLLSNFYIAKNLLSTADDVAELALCPRSAPPSELTSGVDLGPGSDQKKTCPVQSTVVPGPLTSSGHLEKVVFPEVKTIWPPSRLTVVDISDNKLWDPQTLETLAMLPELSVLYTSK
jgi:hypothetical protein